MNPEQQSVFDIMVSGKNVFITSCAGTGKTFLLNKFIDYCKNNNKKICVTSMTGISALLLNGKTLHSALGIGLGTLPTLNLITTIKKNPFSSKIWRDLEILLIDEVSMLSNVLFDKLHDIACAIRRNDLPFGNIQLVLSGDLLQLPVISKNETFLINSDKWESCNIKKCVLNTIMRQNETDLVETMNDVRLCTLTPKTIAMLKLLASKKQSTLPNTIQPTKLFSTNNLVDEENMKQLSLLQQKGNKVYVINGKVIYYSDNILDKSYIDKWLSIHTTPLKLFLCCNMQVVLTCNLDVENGLANGSRGIVTGFTEKKLPIVKFMNGKYVTITPALISIEHRHKIVGKFWQIPLKIAFALTIHSCQGSTLDCVLVDCKNMFEYGQFYTAISRVKKMEGLFIKNLDLSAIKAHPQALDFYNDNYK
jgi:ATP-dependent DNA helicase PIF1